MPASTTVPGTEYVPMVNGRCWAFAYNGWEYQIISLNGTDTVRLHYRASPVGRWEVGHSRPTDGRGAHLVAREIHAHIVNPPSGRTTPTMSNRRIGDQHDADTFTLTLATLNSALRTYDDDGDDHDAVVDPSAVADLLDGVAARLRQGHRDGQVSDANGNHVGEFRLG